MGELKKAAGKNEFWGGSTSSSITQAVNAASSSSSSSSSNNNIPSPPSLHSRLLLKPCPSAMAVSNPTIHRQVVSIWTCSKLCAFCFVAGIVVGFTLKRRVRRWASTLLRRLKDD